MSAFTAARVQQHNARVAAEAIQAAEKRHDNPTRPEIPNAEQRECAKKLGSRDAGETPSPGCPHVRFTLRRVRLLDVDSKFHSCKDLIDALTHCGAIPGDKEGQITLEVLQERVSKYDLEETIIEITTP